jgi:hypothetical protein
MSAQRARRGVDGEQGWLVPAGWAPERSRQVPRQAAEIVKYLIVHFFSLDVPPGTPDGPPSCEVPNVRHAGTGIAPSSEGVGWRQSLTSTIV